VILIVTVKVNLVAIVRFAGRVNYLVVVVASRVDYRVVLAVRIIVTTIKVIHSVLVVSGKVDLFVVATFDLQDLL
jgi:hypothetical protein